MTLTRRDLIKGIAGITAAGILLPDEEVTKKFWRGWSASPASAALLQPSSTLSGLSAGDWVFLLDDRTTMDGALSIWTGERFVRPIGGIYGTVRVEKNDKDIIPYEVGGFRIMDMSNHRIASISDPPRVPERYFSRSGITHVPHCTGGSGQRFPSDSLVTSFVSPDPGMVESGNIVGVSQHKNRWGDDVWKWQEAAS